MKYALLLYAAPGAAQGVQPADDGVMNSWLDYTAAMKESGVLLAAEQLAYVDTATSVTARQRGHDGRPLVPVRALQRDSYSRGARHAWPSRTGRTSIVPYRTIGILPAQSSAASRSGTSSR